MFLLLRLCLHREGDFLGRHTVPKEPAMVLVMGLKEGPPKVGHRGQKEGAFLRG